MRRTAITGWAWRTPLGAEVDEVMRRLWAGARAAAPLTRFAADTFACRTAAVIEGEPVPGRHQRFLRRMGAFALDVAREAVAVARPPAAGERLGLFFGYGGLRAHWNDMMPALAAQRPDGADAWARGLQLLHPFWMLQHLSNNAHALAAQELDARGDGLTLAGANAGAQALATAARALAAGVIDAAVVVACDTLIEPETLVELAGRGAFTGEAPPRAPYDGAALGFVPGEAAAAVVLERRADAGARSLALVDAWDAADGSAPGAAGDPLQNVLATVPRAWSDDSRARGDDAGMVGVVEGAARARPADDDNERHLLAARTDLVSATTPICATLAAMGQLGAAATIVQAIALGAALRAGRLAPIAGLVRAAAGPLRPLIAAESTTARVGLGLSTGAPGLAGAVRVELP